MLEVSPEVDKAERLLVVMEEKREVSSGTRISVELVTFSKVIDELWSCSNEPLDVGTSVGKELKDIPCCSKEVELPTSIEEMTVLPRISIDDKGAESITRERILVAYAAVVSKYDERLSCEAGTSVCFA